MESSSTSSLAPNLPDGSRFQIYVRLQLAVELFTFTVGMVMPDEFLVSEARIGPSHIGLDVRNKKKLPIFVNRALNDEMTSTFQEDVDVLGRIISKIKPEEQGFIRQLAAEADGLIKEP